jgi:hypothetical protein
VGLLISQGGRCRGQLCERRVSLFRSEKNNDKTIQNMVFALGGTRYASFGVMNLKRLVLIVLCAFMAIAPGCFCAVDKGGARGGITTP